jgi:lipoprotein signal peptidase
MMYALVALVVAVDQTTKIGYDDPVNASVPFSEGHGSQSVWLPAVGLLLGLVVAWVFRHPWWGVGLAMGGILSNLIDRTFYGGVRDPIAWGPYWWNVADLAAAVGLMVCVIYYAAGMRSPTVERG